MNDKTQKTEDHLAPTERPPMPAPETLIRQGITTPETIAYQEKEPLPSPVLQNTPEGRETWEEAKQRAADERRTQIAETRQTFEDRFRKVRLDFETARQNHRVPEGYER